MADETRRDDDEPATAPEPEPEQRPDARRRRQRRGAGEGALYRDPTRGGWVAKLWVTDAGGTRRRLTHRARTKAECQQWLRETARAADEGTIAPRAAAALTVEAFAQRYLELVEATRGPGTARVYRSIIRNHVLPLLGSLPLVRLRPDQVQQVSLRMREHGLATRTIQVCHAVLHSMLDLAVEWRYLGRNPADAVTLPAGRAAAETQPLALDEALALLRSVTGDPLEALYWLALTTGMRQSELVGLRWSDVDLTARLIRVRWQITRESRARDGDTRFVPPKSRSSVRVVPLIPQAVGALERRRAQQALERRVSGTRWQEADLVFTLRDGQPLHHHGLQVHWRRQLQRAGLPYRQFHSTRHTANTLLLGLGVPARVRQAILGHARLDETELTYAHVLPEMLSGAAERLARLLLSEASEASGAEAGGDDEGDVQGAGASDGTAARSTHGAPSDGRSARNG